VGQAQHFNKQNKPLQSSAGRTRLELWGAKNRLSLKNFLSKQAKPGLVE